MKLLERLLPKVASVEEIHKEFDTAQDRILDECDQILADLKIPTETQVEKKAKMLEELGFVNSETVEQAKRLKENSKEIKQKIDITARQAETIKYFKQKYPFEKFITTEELDRICNKYNLIHAPVSNYIKDIPEKNVLEMKNCKKLENVDKCEVLYRLLELNEDAKKLVRYLGKEKPLFTLKEADDLCTAGYGYTPESWSLENGDDAWFTIGGRKLLEQKLGGNFRINYKKTEKIDKSGLFIAAPKSHFNLQGLDKKSKFGFFKVQVLEVKDPVVFEYCRDGIVRIISKWGVEGEDKAYLDPVLQNEILN